jgi:putative membrane protein insertion efficiency factor
MTWRVRLAMLFVQAYRLGLSPFMGGACRFHPTCSAYALEAVELHGVTRGVWLALRRTARCHPFSLPAIDPVPPSADGR